MRTLTLKQMLAEADSLLERLDEALADDERAMQILIEDVPQFLDTIRKTMGDLNSLTHKVQAIYLDRLHHIQANMADRRAMMRDAGAVAQEPEQPSGESMKAHAEEMAGLKEAA